MCFLSSTLRSLSSPDFSFFFSLQLPALRPSTHSPYSLVSHTTITTLSPLRRDSHRDCYARRLSLTVPTSSLSLSNSSLAATPGAPPPVLLAIPASLVTNDHHLKTFLVTIPNQAETFFPPSLSAQWHRHCSRISLAISRHFRRGNGVGGKFPSFRCGNRPFEGFFRRDQAMTRDDNGIIQIPTLLTSFW
ncbi:hypothetical protein D8674_003745 [Pyrus ussuriensis x Pyrus communis]|uniref:Uncharacterized protein n=1 Tax=Pyrus ussuriensis x Pyrus communis TaxID=2448454 RepID=A0A5N5FN65_9ROSA|nr:hypothetical protein D8674_003745 [Pyrus ussuriensis x Pyrus communis]